MRKAASRRPGQQGGRSSLQGRGLWLQGWRPLAPTPSKTSPHQHKGTQIQAQGASTAASSALRIQCLLYQDQHVNNATKINNDHLDNWALYKVFVTADSLLVNEDPSLAWCPTSIWCGAVDEAVQARKALITRFGSQGCIPDIGLLPLDPSRPFCFTLAAVAGWIVPQWRDANDPSQGQWNPKLELLTRMLKAQKVDSTVHIHLHGQAACRWLLEHCQQKVVCEGHGKIKQQALHYELPREWQLQLDRFGDYFFILQYKVPQSEYIVQQMLEGHNLLVCSVDPGVWTALAVYSSDGTTLDFGSQKDCNRLTALCLERD